jgi:hypothetical protein
LLKKYTKNTSSGSIGVENYIIKYFLPKQESNMVIEIIISIYKCLKFAENKLTLAKDVFPQVLPELL